MWSRAASLGAPVTEPGREGGGDGVGPPAAGAQAAPDRRHQVDQAGVVLDREQGGHLDRAELAHPAEVVADEVDDHHVLGAVLVGEPARVGRGALDRAGLDDVAVARQEPLGRRGRDVAAVGGEPHDRAVRRRVALGERGAEGGHVGARRAAARRAGG